MSDQFDYTTPEAKAKLETLRPVMRLHVANVLVAVLLKDQGYDKAKFHALRQNLLTDQFPSGPGANDLGLSRYAFDEALAAIEGQL
jgi:hypothetical protein